MSQAAESPTASEILGQLDRILASDLFAGSQRMRELLRYLVDEALRDGRPRLKELAIGMAVFRRDESFDPRIDSVVRVEVGRLRTKLREYYADAGAADTVRIAIPKGAYAPSFKRIAPAIEMQSPLEHSPSRRWLPAVMAVAIATAFGLVFAIRGADDSTEEIAAPPYSIAVLPLSDWTGNADDYFSEAMTDVLIAELSERPDLRVTSLSSVMNYRNGELQPSQIAKQLGVANIVEGTVFRESGRVRITANLIDAEENRTIWSKSFNRSMSNVLMLQEEVASEIATQLAGELLPAAPVSDREINPLAYESYLKGTYWRNRLTAEGFNRGLLFFHQAVELQPDYAQAYAAMAACHCRLAGHGIEVVRPDLALPDATRLATRALELDNTLAEPNAVLGIIKFKYDWDADAARAYLERALQQNPSLFEAHLWMSQVAEGMERFESAVEHARLAYQVNPLSHAAILNLGWQLHQAGETAEAGVQFDSLIEFDPGFWGGHWGKGQAYLKQGHYPDAIDEFSRAVELDGGHTLPMASLGYAYALAGRRADALAMIDKLELMSKDIYVSPVHTAMIYAGLKENDAAFEWLNKAFEVRARALAWLTVKQEFAGLRGDPRYDELISAIGISRKGSG